jgi:alkylation response protein AidB-like acyl-CoA dehydrogenase
VTLCGQQRTAERVVKLQWSDDENSFRNEVRDFLSTHLDDDLRAAGRLMTSAYAEHAAAMRWQQVLMGRGWAAPSWPKEHGGCGWSAAQRYIFAQELAASGAPPLSPMGIDMCGPVLIQFGTDSQKRFFLPKMLTGEHFWCQGYSEPNSGSDLASLQMSAADAGDALLCNGSKIWTTHADLANWIFCLVRTSRETKSQAGITFLLIDMTTPGITVAPIVLLSGEHILNQVYFEGVRVPKSNVVGTIGNGWRVAKYLLEFERGGMAYSPKLHQRLESIRQFAAGSRGDGHGCLLDDEPFASQLASAGVQVSALEMFELQLLARLSAGQSPGTAASVLKILGTELQQEVTRLALAAAGHDAHAYQANLARPGGAVRYGTPVPTRLPGGEETLLAPLRYLNERVATIYAGSNEIQRNILAKAALGL